MAEYLTRSRERDQRFVHRSETTRDRPRKRRPHDVRCRPTGGSPPALLAFVLVLQPRAERAEVLDQRGGVGLRFAGEHGEGLRPRLALTELQHGAELRAGFLVAVDGARVERPLVAGGLAERAMELELVDAREEVPDVRRRRGDVVLRARVEV